MVNDMENLTEPILSEPHITVTPAARVLFLTVDGVLFVVITFGNTLVILSVATYHRLQTPTNMFLASLAVADLFVALICLPVDALLAQGLVLTVSPWVCITGSMMTTIAISVSLTQITTVVYDRFLAITKPLKYHQKMTPRKVTLFIVASWASSILLSLLPLLGWNRIDSYSLDYCDLLFIQVFSYRFTITVGISTIPVSLMVYMYLRIFLVARQHNRRIAAENLVFNQQGGRALTRDLKAAKTLAIVFGTFLAAVTPATIVAVADVVFPVSDLFIYELVCFHVLFANSAMNPVTYAFRSREFRIAFIKLLSKFFRCKRWKELARRANQSLVHETDWRG